MNIVITPNLCRFKQQNQYNQNFKQKISFCALNTNKPSEDDVFMRSVYDDVGRAVQCETEMDDFGNFNRKEFEKLAALREKTCPTLHDPNIAVHRMVNEFTHIYMIPGSDPNAPGVLILGHDDVVPANQNGKGWTHGPFSGAIVNGDLEGRGTLDNKLEGFISMKLANKHLEEGWRPKGPLFIVFTHDEEANGFNGARVASEEFGKMLEGLGLKEVGLSINEGSFIAKGGSGVLPGNPSKDIAAINIAEKGILNQELVSTDLISLCKAISNLQDNPFPAKMNGPVEQMFHELSPHMKLPHNILLRHRFSAEPLLKGASKNDPTANAYIRPTNVVTIIDGSINREASESDMCLKLTISDMNGGHSHKPASKTANGEMAKAIVKLDETPLSNDMKISSMTIQSGDKANVIPSSASAYITIKNPGSILEEDLISELKGIINNDKIEVKIAENPINPSNLKNSGRAVTNLRLDPEVSEKAVMEHLIKTIDDPEIQVKDFGFRREFAPRIADTNSPWYRFVAEKIKELVPGVETIPAMGTATTDTPYFAEHAHTSVGLIPAILDKQGIASIHGDGEKISLENIKLITDFMDKIIVEGCDLTNESLASLKKAGPKKVMKLISSKKLKV